MNKRKRTELRVFILYVSLLSGFTLFTTPDAKGAPQSSYAAGIQAYRQKNYKLASQLLTKGLTEGNNGALAWLYLGHSYTGMGDRLNAINTYRAIVTRFPGSPESQLANQCIASLDPTAALSMPAPSTQAGAAPQAARGQSLSSRITVFPPKSGHPPVNQAVLPAVRTALSQLPGSIYRLLDEKGATVTIAPNIDDKWPGSGDSAKPGVADGTLGEEPGRTYGRDVHIYERKKVRGSNELKEARSVNEMLRVLYHELGHAVDDCLGVPSNDPRFQAELQKDLNAMSDSDRADISYYTKPMECFSEITGTYLSRSSDAHVANLCPNAARWVKSKVGL